MRRATADDIRETENPSPFEKGFAGGADGGLAGEFRAPAEFQVIQAEHGGPLIEQPIHQVAADEPSGASDQALLRCGHVRGMKAISGGFVEVIGTGSKFRLACSGLNP